MCSNNLFQFEKWTDDQRKKILEGLIVKCKPKQKEFVRDYVKDNIPVTKRDFTRHLPRVISLYIFSFLDPRSLSRCAQVNVLKVIAMGNKRLNLNSVALDL